MAGGLLSLISHLPRLEAGTAETTMLEAVASAAAEADPAEVFDYLCTGSSTLARALGSP